MNDNHHVMGDLMIKKAAPPDSGVVLDLLTRQFDEHHLDLHSEELLLAIRSMLEDERLGFILLAFNQGQVVGIACVPLTWTLEHGGSSAWLDELYVLPEFRGLGIGSALIERVVVLCCRLGCKALDLEVELDHSRAEHLYRRYGFEPLPRRRWVRHFQP